MPAPAVRPTRETRSYWNVTVALAERTALSAGDLSIVVGTTAIIGMTGETKTTDSIGRRRTVGSSGFASLLIYPASLSRSTKGRIGVGVFNVMRPRIVVDVLPNGSLGRAVLPRSN